MAYMTVLQFPKREITADPRRYSLGIRRDAEGKISFDLDGFAMSDPRAATIAGEILTYLARKA